MAERDFGAWKVEDKAWMAQRQKQWKVVRKHLEKSLKERGKESLTLLKSYYLTGSAPPEWKRELRYIEKYDVTRPLMAATVQDPLVFECWMSADTSEEAWQAIKEAYQNLDGEWFSIYWEQARKFLRYHVLRSYPAEGSLFDGLDERLYRFFGPTRCRREDFPEMEDGRFLNHSYFVRRNVNEWLVDFLSKDNTNPQHIVQYQVREWGDTILPYQQYIQCRVDEVGSNARLFWWIEDPAMWSHYRLLCAEQSMPEQVAVAKEIEAIIREVYPQLCPESAAAVDEGFASAETMARERGRIP